MRPSCVRRVFTADCLLGLWVRIPPGARISGCWKCSVLSGRGLCDGPIPRPEVSYRLWCVTVCDLQTLKMRRPWPTLGCCPRKECSSCCIGLRYDWCRVCHNRNSNNKTLPKYCIWILFGSGLIAKVRVCSATNNRTMSSCARLKFRVPICMTDKWQRSSKAQVRAHRQLRPVESVKNAKNPSRRRCFMAQNIHSAR